MQHRKFARGAASALNPYDELQLSKSATEKEIKIAYFREAKTWHPDLNPNDPTAKAKFQRVAAAYEILSDSSKRRQYDTTGNASANTNSNSESASSTSWNDANSGFGSKPEDTFTSVQEDLEVIKAALRGYISDVQSEFAFAAKSASSGRWEEVWEVAKNYKGIIFGFVVPAVLLIRFPAAIFAVGRMLLFLGEGAVAILITQGKVQYVARWLWKQIVKLSIEQNKRRRAPR